MCCGCILFLVFSGEVFYHYMSPYFPVFRMSMAEVRFNGNCQDIYWVYPMFIYVYNLINFLRKFKHVLNAYSHREQIPKEFHLISIHRRHVVKLKQKPRKKNERARCVQRIQAFTHTKSPRTYSGWWIDLQWKARQNIICNATAKCSQSGRSQMRDRTVCHLALALLLPLAGLFS